MTEKKVNWKAMYIGLIVVLVLQIIMYYAISLYFA